MVAVTVEARSTAKSTLRRWLRSARRERLPERDVAAEATAVADRVLRLVAEHTGGQVCRVAAYESMPTEPPTALLVERLTAAGYEVIVPHLMADADLDWRVTGAPESLGRTAIDGAAVVVVPALAVDRDGNRLGQGGGSYDRALARRRPDALVVALLHDGELLPAGTVPVEPHDVAVHMTVTPTAVVRLPSA
jgi:5-formyltetrahydrofolate cyclo-ligase